MFSLNLFQLYISIYICVCVVANDFLEYNGAVRLVDGSYTSSGRLEVFLNSQWGAVCNTQFPLSIAGVVCRQLGYTEASDVNSVR